MEHFKETKNRDLIDRARFVSVSRAIIVLEVIHVRLELSLCGCAVMSLSRRIVVWWFCVYIFPLRFHALL
jgi:hypothetical protein